MLPSLAHPAPLRHGESWKKGLFRIHMRAARRGLPLSSPGQQVANADSDAVKHEPRMTLRRSNGFAG